MGLHTLYHVTQAEAVSSISQDGMRPLSYWSNSEALVAYYRETVEDDGLVPVVLTIELDDLIRSVGEQSIEPDFPGIEEPISGAIGKSESLVISEWSSSNRSWQDSLEIIGSLRCRAPIPACNLRLLNQNETSSKPLVEITEAPSRSPRPRLG